MSGLTQEWLDHAIAGLEKTQIAASDDFLFTAFSVRVDAECVPCRGTTQYVLVVGPSTAEMIRRRAS